MAKVMYSMKNYHPFSFLLERKDENNNKEFTVIFPSELSATVVVWNYGLGSDKLQEIRIRDLITDEIAETIPGDEAEIERRISSSNHTYHNLHKELLSMNTANHLLGGILSYAIAIEEDETYNYVVPEHIELVNMNGKLLEYKFDSDGKMKTSMYPGGVTLHVLKSKKKERALSLSPENYKSYLFEAEDYIIASFGTFKYHKRDSEEYDTFYEEAICGMTITKEEIKESGS